MSQPTTSQTAGPLSLAMTEAKKVIELAERQLRGSRYTGLMNVHCDFYEGVLILRGQVDSYYLKQLAQTFVRNIPQVGQIDNRLDVVDPRSRT